MSLIVHVKRFRKNIGKQNPDHGEPIFVHFVYLSAWGTWRVDLHMEWVGGEQTRIYTTAKTPRQALSQAYDHIEVIQPNRTISTRYGGAWEPYRKEKK